MPIGGWLAFGTFSLIILYVCGDIWADVFGCTKLSGVVLGFIAFILIVALLFNMLWCYNNAAVGQRKLIDQKSSLGKGLDRTVTVYTANGDVIAQYTGQIDIETNDGGYIKFDFEGKQYIYYNCFVETIAEIE